MSEHGDPVTVAPVLTVATPERDRIPGQVEVINGTVDLRKTHPNMWRALMVFAAANVLLGLNFVFLHPTFLIYDASNYVWGVCFLVLAAAKIGFTNLYRNLTLVRLTMAAEVAYMLFLALGATEPFLTGSGSLQLPILYATMSVLEFALLLEPCVNPWTARRD